jgi:hypothetical protein
LPARADWNRLENELKRFNPNSETDFQPRMDTDAHGWEPQRGAEGARISPEVLEETEGGETRMAREHQAPHVAQIFNLPCRGFAIRKASADAARFGTSHVPPGATRRYSRVQLCATMVAASAELG